MSLNQILKQIVKFQSDFIQIRKFLMTEINVRQSMIHNMLPTSSHGHYSNEQHKVKNPLHFR